MGCNIHGCVEAKIYGKDWNWLCDIPNYRDYRFYAKIGNVRNDDGVVKPISMPRGMPPDVTSITKATYGYNDENTGVHSLSYLDVDELYSIGDLYHPFWVAYLRFLYKLGDVYDDEKVRIVFWFDN
jgi:hypothetical protein